MSKEVRIVNTRQATMYIKHGADLLRLYVDTNTDKLVFVFDREKTLNLYDKWCKYELN